MTELNIGKSQFFSICKRVFQQIQWNLKFKAWSTLAIAKNIAWHGKKRITLRQVPKCNLKAIIYSLKIMIIVIIHMLNATFSTFKFSSPIVQILYTNSWIKVNSIYKFYLCNQYPFLVTNWLKQSNLQESRINCWKK